MLNVEKGAEMLRLTRKEAKVSLQYLAVELGRALDRTISHQRISQWEQGRDGGPDFFQARGLDEILGAGGAILNAYGYRRRDDGGATPGVLARLARLERLEGIDEPPPDAAPSAPPRSRSKRGAS